MGKISKEEIARLEGMKMAYEIAKEHDALSEYIDDAWDFVSDIGKRETGILELYMLAFKLAQEQLKEGGTDGYKQI